MAIPLDLNHFGGFTFAFAEPDQDPTSQLIDELGAILEKSLNSELSDLEKYKKRIASEEQYQIYLTAAYNGYRIQLSSFWNLLLSEDADISQLQKSRAELKNTMVDAQKIFDELIPEEEALKQELEHLQNQKLLVDKQLAELAGVVGVGIDGGLCQMPDLHVVGHALGDGCESVLKGGHRETLLEKRKEVNRLRTTHSQPTFQNDCARKKRKSL